MRKILALLALLAPICFTTPAHAQLSNAVVVAACGTPPATYSPGATRQVTQDTAGNVCTDASATGTFDNPAAGTTGNAVPGSADYTGLNIGGNLRGQTGVNPSGVVYAAQSDLTSVAGATVKTGAGTASGAVRVELPTDGTGKVSLNGYSFSNITTATTTTLVTGSGVLHGITINAKGTVASTVTIYDNTAGSGTKIGIIDSLNLSGSFGYDANFATGLTIVTTGTVAPDITVLYRAN